MSVFDNTWTAAEGMDFHITQETFKNSCKTILKKCSCAEMLLVSINLEEPGI